jgi:outer membrane receptor protein involved in Fe transport
LPSVSVDPNGVVSVRGTSDFMVYLNGKPTQMEPSMLLAQISGNSIESIDVITVPTAKYDAQGKGGIINITTKKSGLEGLSVSANGLTGGAPWGNFTAPLSNYKENDNRLGGGLNLTYMKNKLSLYGGLYYNKKNVNGRRTGDARLLQENGSYYHMVSDGERPEWYEYSTANAAVDYHFNSNSSILASYFYGNRTEGRSAFYIYHNFYGDVDKNPIIDVPVNEDWLYNPNKRNRYGIFHAANIDFTQQFTDKSELKISALYEHSVLKSEMENRHYYFTPSSEVIGDIKEHFKQTDDAPLDGYRLSIDYNKELSNGHSWGFGVQPQFLKISGEFSYDTLDVLNKVWGDYSAFENAIDLTRGIYAGYFDYSGSTGKIKFVAGLRLEYTDQVINIVNPEYFTIFERLKKPRYAVNQLDWFPSLHVSFDISDKNKVTFAASRRINRPPVNNMTPFLYREHYEVYVVGDPALEPEYLTNFELFYEKKIGNQNINLTGFYRRVNNAVFRVNTVFEEENVLIRSYTNSANTKALGLELNANFKVRAFAKFFLSCSLYDFRVEGDIFGYKENNRSTNWSLKGNANFILTESLKFTVDFDMKSATVTAQGRNEFFYMTNAALNYAPKPLKGWDFSLKALDILGSNITGLNTHAFNSDGEQIFYQEVEYARYGPIVEFSINYALNMNDKSRRKADSTFGKEQF